MEASEKIAKLKEKIFLKTNKSPILLLFRIIFAILFVDIIIILSFSFVDFVNIEKAWFFNMYSFEENIFIFALLFHLFFFVYLFIHWFVDFYTIKAWKVTHENWIFFKKRDTYIISQINTIELLQSFLGRFFDYWDIVLYYNEKEFILKNVPHPEEFTDFIELFKIED